jgi:hypothetical protein
MKPFVGAWLLEVEWILSSQALLAAGYSVSLDRLIRHFEADWRFTVYWRYNVSTVVDDL